MYGPQLTEKLCEMLTSGIPVTLNSDDPAYFGAYLNANYEYMAGIANLGPADLADLAKASFTASFIPEDDKAAAHKQIDQVLAMWSAEQQKKKQSVVR